MQPKVERIYPQLAGNAVDMGLDGEDSLRLSRGAHEATWDGVGIHLHARCAHAVSYSPPAFAAPPRLTVGTLQRHRHRCRTLPWLDAPPWYRRVSPRF